MHFALEIFDLEGCVENNPDDEEAREVLNSKKDKLKKLEKKMKILIMKDKVEDYMNTFNNPDDADDDKDAGAGGLGGGGFGGQNASGGTAVMNGTLEA